MESFIIGMAVGLGWFVMNWRRAFHYQLGGAIVLSAFAGLLQ